MIVKVWLRQGHRSRAETQAIRSFNCRTSLQQLHLLEQSHQWQIRGNTVWRWKQTLRKVVQFVSQLNGGSNEFEQYFEIVSALNWIYYIYIWIQCWLWNLRLTCRLLLLCILASIRSCEWLIEQPSSSTFVHCPYLKFAQRAFRRHIKIGLQRLSDPQFGTASGRLSNIFQLIIWPLSWMGLFGAKSPKLTLVIGTPLGTQGISYHFIPFEVCCTSWGVGKPSCFDLLRRSWKPNWSCLQKALWSKNTWSAANFQCRVLKI